MENVTRKGMSETERVLRKQMSEEIGEEDVIVPREELAMLQQKFGLRVPKITRATINLRTSAGNKVVELFQKPNWMGVSEWKMKLGQWNQLVKGALTPLEHLKESAKPKTVAAVPTKAFTTNESNRYTKPYSRTENLSLKKKFRTERNQFKSRPTSPQQA